VVRGLILGTAIPGALAMMTGTAFILFSNYMITDPGTSPSKPWSQVAFGGGVAAVYGLLTGFSITYAIFFATAIVCLIRGGFLWAVHFVNKARAAQPAQPAVAPMAGPVGLATAGGPVDTPNPREAVAA
jgi:hypothetical protein